MYLTWFPDYTDGFDVLGYVCIDWICKLTLSLSTPLSVCGVISRLMNLPSKKLIGKHIYMCLLSFFFRTSLCLLSFNLSLCSFSMCNVWRITLRYLLFACVDNHFRSWRCNYLIKSCINHLIWSSLMYAIFPADCWVLHKRCTSVAAWQVLLKIETANGI